MTLRSAGWQGHSMHVFENPQNACEMLALGAPALAQKEKARLTANRDTTQASTAQESSMDHVVCRHGM